MAAHNSTGKMGENIAAVWLQSCGFRIIDRNYRKKAGEIDIVARGTDKKLHFIEVKSVSHGTKGELVWSVTHETWRPEENVHAVKQRRLRHIIEIWLLEHRYGEEWCTDILVVRMVPREKFAHVTMLPDVIFE